MLVPTVNGLDVETVTVQVLGLLVQLPELVLAGSVVL